VSSLNAKLVVPSLAEFAGIKSLFRKDGVDRVAVKGLSGMPYDVGNLRMNRGPGIPIWFWHSVGATHNAFETETFIGELMPAAEKVGWGTPLPAKRARGIAVIHCFGGWAAEIA